MPSICGRLARLMAVAAVAAAADTSPNCVLAGPGFPVPASLSNSSLLADADAQFEALLTNQSLGLQANDTAWAVALFSSKENKTLYERYYTPPIDVGVKSVDRDSIFRIGSVSKVFTVWSFLLEVGDEHFNEPITKYIPELANLSSSDGDGAIYDDINRVRWEEITLGELASHAAGIPRDATDYDLGAQMTPEEVSALGFPVLNKSDVPTCGISGVTPRCTREEMFPYLLQKHPIYPVSSSPAYTNTGFTLLAYVLEAITGKSINTTITQGIFDALGMDHSSYEAIPDSNGVIPGNNASLVGWDWDFGQSNPSGSIYSSTADMVKAGQAILQSTLLSRAQTRRWFKPLIQTGYLGTAVGAPWEIRYLQLPNQRMVQVLTKQGDVGNYHAALILSPEHELGWIVLASGVEDSTASDIRDELMNAFGTTFLPVAEEQARQEATPRFNGTYVDEATNSSVTVLADDLPGLVVPSLISRGVQIIGPDSVLIATYGAGESARLFPSQLRTVSRKENGGEGYESRLGFKATFFKETAPDVIEDPCIYAWTALGAPTYGQRTLDDWVFELGEDGRAEALDVRMLQLRMTRLG